MKNTPIGRIWANVFHTFDSIGVFARQLSGQINLMFTQFKAVIIPNFGSAVVVAYATNSGSPKNSPGVPWQDFYLISRTL